jgi:hypothetical protein
VKLDALKRLWVYAQVKNTLAVKTPLSLSAIPAA